MLGMRYSNGQWVDSLGTPIKQFIAPLINKPEPYFDTYNETSEFKSRVEIIDNDLQKTISELKRGSKIIEDVINSPKHYARGKYEVIKIIEYFNLNFRLANVIKYVLRAGVKNPDKHVEDLEKARWYLDREINILKGIIVVGDDAND